mmetsp:Transcript_35233/g.113283  ORF Transcript_35233/g.113283 Transcript_35233/m.113283 type:complete len:322 (+) Transcript_35233:450-1415(+)
MWRRSKGRSRSGSPSKLGSERGSRTPLRACRATTEGSLRCETLSRASAIDSSSTYHGRLRAVAGGGSATAPSAGSAAAPSPRPASPAAAATAALSRAPNPCTAPRNASSICSCVSLSEIVSSRIRFSVRRRETLSCSQPGAASAAASPSKTVVSPARGSWLSSCSRVTSSCHSSSVADCIAEITMGAARAYASSARRPRTSTSERPAEAMRKERESESSAERAASVGTRGEMRRARCDSPRDVTVQKRGGAPCATGSPRASTATSYCSSAPASPSGESSSTRSPSGSSHAYGKVPRAGARCCRSHPFCRTARGASHSLCST